MELSKPQSRPKANQWLRNAEPQLRSEYRRELEACYIEEYIAKCGQQLNLPADIVAYAKAMYLRVHHMGYQKHRDVIAVTTACIFGACRRHDTRWSFVSMVEKMRAPVEGTLLALWGIEHFFSAEVVEQVVLSITWEESDGPSAFAVNEGPQKEARLTWPGNNEVVLPAGYDTNSPTLMDIRMGRLSEPPKSAETLVYHDKAKPKHAIQKASSSLDADAESENYEEEDMEEVALSDEEVCDWDTIEWKKEVRAAQNGKREVENKWEPKEWASAIRRGFELGLDFAEAVFLP